MSSEPTAAEAVRYFHDLGRLYHEAAYRATLGWGAAVLATFAGSAIVTNLQWALWLRVGGALLSVGMTYHASRAILLTRALRALRAYAENRFQP